MKKILYLLPAVMLLTACWKKAEICGTYNGLLPAADGPGIDITLQLNNDGTFISKLIYVGKEDGTFYENGTYRHNGNLLELKTGNEISYYRWENTQLRLLDYQKEAISGPLADHYILKKTKECSAQ